MNRDTVKPQTPLPIVLQVDDRQVVTIDNRKANVVTLRVHHEGRWHVFDVRPVDLYEIALAALGPANGGQ